MEYVSKKFISFYPFYNACYLTALLHSVGIIFLISWSEKNLIREANYFWYLSSEYSKWKIISIINVNSYETFIHWYVLSLKFLCFWYILSNKDTTRRKFFTYLRESYTSFVFHRVWLWNGIGLQTLYGWKGK